MYESNYVAPTRNQLDEPLNVLARRYVDGRNAHIVPGVAQNVCRRIRVLRAHIR
jgi:hypothetical protein